MADVTKSKATVSAVVGPGKSISSLVLNNVTAINYDLARQVCFITVNYSTVREFDINAISTLTVTVNSDKSHTVTIS